ncbi:hypothetical protein BJ742DRAFT_736478 [Cladochytrium replicatum]|nr:hypothetical protein BJ742DRAFT_736478 [Cladochytrium replicatum]
MTRMVTMWLTGIVPPKEEEHYGEMRLEQPEKAAGLANRRGVWKEFRAAQCPSLPSLRELQPRHGHQSEPPVATADASRDPSPVEQSPALQKKQSFSSRIYSTELAKSGKVAESPASVDVMCPTVGIRKISKISVTLINGDTKAAVARTSAVGKAHVEESSGLCPALPGVRGGPLTVTGGNSHVLAITVEAHASMYPGSPLKPRSAAEVDTAHAVDEEVFRFNLSGAIKVDGRGKLERQVLFHPMMRVVLEIEHNGQPEGLDKVAEGTNDPSVRVCRSPRKAPGSSMDAEAEGDFVGWVLVRRRLERTKAKGILLSISRWGKIGFVQDRCGSGPSLPPTKIRKYYCGIPGRGDHTGNATTAMSVPQVSL